METTLLEKVEKLPYDKRKEVEDFVDFLLFKSNADQLEPGNKFKPIFGSGKDFFSDMTDDFNEPLNEKPKLKREFGSLKGFVTYMADDFDGPLDEFKSIIS